VQTIKTAVVVVLLLFVLYGGYVALKGTDTQLAEELEQLVSLDETSADVSGPGAFQPAQPKAESGSADPFARFASLPAPSFSSAPAMPPASAMPPAPSAIPPSTSTLPGAPPTEIPELELPSGGLTSPSLPSVGNPSDLPADGKPQDISATLPGADRKVAATNASAKSEPGFGLAIPSTRSADAALLPKPPGASPAAVPPLDLPSLHGDAKNLGEVTTVTPTPTVPPTPTDAVAPDGIPASKPGRSFENAKQLAMDKIEESKLKEALATLSVFYNAEELTGSQRDDLLDMLDALAREVIYSRSHLMDFPYVIAPGETLEQVSKRYNVPPEVLARINGLDPSREPPAGTKMKIVPGPFRAEVDLKRSEITLFVGDLYAGRYPASFGADQEIPAGIYQVLDKQRERNFYGRNGMQIAATDPTNPYGGYWIDLGQDLCIHGSPEAEGTAAQLGCISLSPLDAGDVFGMLGRGSQVTIRR